MSAAGSPIQTRFFPETSTAAIRKGTIKRIRSLWWIDPIRSASAMVRRECATSVPPRAMSPKPMDSRSVRGDTTMFAPNRSSWSWTAPSIWDVRDAIATKVAIPRKMPSPVKTARDLRRSRFLQASVRRFIRARYFRAPRNILARREVGLLTTMNPASSLCGQRVGIAPPLLLADPVGCELLAAVVAHHPVLFLPVPLVRPEADVAGVERRAVLPVPASESEVVHCLPSDSIGRKSAFPESSALSGILTRRPSPSRPPPSRSPPGIS